MWDELTASSDNRSTFWGNIAPFNQNVHVFRDNAVAHLIGHRVVRTQIFYALRNQNIHLPPFIVITIMIEG